MTQGGSDFDHKDFDFVGGHNNDDVQDDGQDDENLRGSNSLSS